MTSKLSASSAALPWYRWMHKRSAEAWGHSLRARGVELPLEALAAAFVLVFQQNRGGVAGRNRPARGGEWRTAKPTVAREEASALQRVPPLF